MIDLSRVGNNILSLLIIAGVGYIIYIRMKGGNLGDWKGRFKGLVGKK